MFYGASPARIAVLLLALFGAGYLWLGLRSADEARLSTWRAPAASQGLTGVAQAQQQGRGLPGGSRPQGNPLQAQSTVMTQGYGVGTHAPAETWGAIDLAIDGDGDGQADAGGSWDHPVYATHDGVVRVTPNSHPAGNHVWVGNDEFRTGYAHLSSFAVSTGQEVRRGDIIGYVGSTGMSSGPHLDYQVWVNQGGAWVNVNPLEFGALDGTGP